MMKKTNLIKHPFTFSEVMAALLLVAIVLPVSVHAILTGNRAGVVAERREVAVRLASNKLHDVVLNDEWLDAETQGVFEEYPDYQWELESETWDGDEVIAMRQLTLSVFFMVQGHVLDTSVTTLVEEVTEE